MEERFTQIFTAVYGAVASALLSRETGWKQLATSIISGSGFAVFVVPYICQRFDVVSPQGVSAAGFVGGFLGNIILVALLKWAQTHNWISLFTNRGKKDEK